MREILENYLKAAEFNLNRYIAMGDENAIRAGLLMVEDFKRELEKLGA